MSWYGYLIVLVPLALIMYMGWNSRKYIHSVADFLSVGRVARRYVMCVSSVANALSVTGLIAYVEMQYKSGLALNFWQSIILPLGTLLSLTGYCYYRFRETRAMSVGQFLEMRYNRKLRIFASGLRSTAEVIANMIMPAVAARFFIYLLDLPNEFVLFGVTFSTFMVLMLITLVLAVSLICFGGALALIITDTMQGLLCYPLLALFIIYVLVKFPWEGVVMPVMADRVADQSFLNPYDIKALQDFNIFSLIVTIVVLFMHQGSWIVTSSAKSAHEQKMAGVLASWRNTFANLLYVMLGIVLVVVLNSQHFSKEAHTIRLELTDKAAYALAPDNKAMQQSIISNAHKMEPVVHRIGVDAPLSNKANIDTIYLNNVHETLLTQLPPEQANAKFQEFTTLYHQLSLPVVVRQMMPGVLMALFTLLMVLAMLSTDDTRIFSSALTISQDVILPFFKKPPTPKQHIRLIKLVAIGVGVIFFFGSYYMRQMDYINLFVTIVCSIWMGGCGPVIIFGLYSRFGTTAGAFTSLISSLFLSVASILVQRNWADVVYPFLQKHDAVESVGNFLKNVSAPFNPYINWEMNPVKCPINSYEFYFIIMMITLLLYCVVSYLTCKEPFNLDRMLHRKEYAVENLEQITADEPRAWSLRWLYNRLVGITPEYTKGDKCIAWGFFIYSFGYQFLICFVLVVIWNNISPWKLEYWGKYFLITTLLIPVVMTVINMFWFMIGGIIDLRHLFKDLAAREINELDNGQVEGSVSLADKVKQKQ